MSTTLYTLIEPLLVALIVLVSVVTVLRKQAPRLWTRITGKAAAASCHDDGKLAPNCGRGGACSACGSSNAGKQTITLHKARR